MAREVARLSHARVVILECGLVVGRVLVLSGCVLPGRAVVRTEVLGPGEGLLGAPVWRPVGGGDESTWDISRELTGWLSVPERVLVGDTVAEEVLEAVALCEGARAFGTVERFFVALLDIGGCDQAEGDERETVLAPVVCSVLRAVFVGPELVFGPGSVDTSSRMVPPPLLMECVTLTACLMVSENGGISSSVVSKMGAVE